MILLEYYILKATLYTLFEAMLYCVYSRPHKILLELHSILTDLTYTQARPHPIPKSSATSPSPTHSHPSIPPLPIHLINQPLSLPLPPNVLPQYPKSPFSINIRRSTHMRRNQHIRRRPQRVISRQRLGISYIQRCTAYQAIVKGLDERRLIDDLSASDVSDVCAARVGCVEESEFVGGEEVGC